MLDSGDRLPEIRLADHGGVPRRFADLAASSGLVLFVQSSHLDEAGLARTLAFRDVLRDASDLGYSVVGLSRDDRAACCRLIAEHDLVFSLLPAASDDLLDRLEVLHGGDVRPTVFVVGARGQVVAVVTENDSAPVPAEGPGGEGDMAQRALSALRVHLQHPTTEDEA